MLTARSVIVAVISIAVLSLLSIVASVLFRSYPDTLQDTYGVHGQGYRALFEILKELGIDTERSIGPPTDVLGAPGTLVLLGPQPDLVKNEPAYLQATRKWVEDGGCVVVTPDVNHDPFWKAMHGVSLTSSGLTELGLPDLTFDAFDPSAGAEVKPPLHKPTDIVEYFDLRFSKKNGTRICATQVEGDPTWNSIDELQVPAEDLWIFRKAPEEALERVAIFDVEKEPRTVAAAFQAGKGRIVVLSDPRILENRNIAAAANSVLAVRLMGDSPRRVVFDEFYHGLTIRGNPFFLISRFPYGMLALATLIVTSFWVWRNSVFLGPPLGAPVVNRRDVAEYMQAMARFLKRGRGVRQYMLQEVKAAVLSSFRLKLELPPGSANVEKIVGALSRRNPSQARELVGACDQIDDLLAGRTKMTDANVLQAAKRITRCH